MPSFTFSAADPKETQLLAAALADLLPERCVVSLTGTLGAGKTHLVRCFAAACGIDPRDVVSPTFVLAQQYSGSRTINHFDAYRLRDEDEFLQLGVDEYFESPAVTFVEWGDRVEAALPEDRLNIQIDVSGPTARQFCVESGPQLHEVVNAMEMRLR